MATITELPETFEVEAAWSETYYEREARGYREVPEGSEPCVCCGRLVKAGRGFDIHFIFGSPFAIRKDLDPSNIDGYDEGGDMGVWAIGPECAKHVPVAYRTARN